MYTSVKVNEGDELVTDTNRRYMVIKIENKQALARFVEDVSTNKYEQAPSSP